MARQVLKDYASQSAKRVSDAIRNINHFKATLLNFALRRAQINPDEE